MKSMFLALSVLASSATALADDTSSRPGGSYDAVMNAQYAARTPANAQRAEEAQRVYDAYLRSIGQKHNNDHSDNAVGDTEAQPH